jgi:hypothetical protein
VDFRLSDDVEQLRRVVREFMEREGRGVIANYLLAWNHLPD